MPFLDDDKQQPLADGSMLNANKPKNDSAWHYKSDLKPLLSSTEYVPVYGDKSKSTSPTSISDDKWQILGRRRIDLLSKYGYSSHRDMKSISPGSELATLADDGWQPSDPNKQNNLFDNCYILGECKWIFIASTFELFKIFIFWCQFLLQVNAQVVRMDCRLIQRRWRP